jgi:hypothetical protein
MIMKQISVVSNPEGLRHSLTQKLESFNYSHSSYTNCARLEKWLFYQPKKLNLPVVVAASLDYRLYSFAKRINPTLNVGLITLNSKAHKSSGLIKTHRDATYASPTAYLVNLGDAVFVYDNKAYQLSDGGIYQFNCKRPHSVVSASEMRFSIVFWTLKDRIKIECETLEDRLDIDF